MLFNSNEFLKFFGLFLAVYILTQRYFSLRNLIIVIASYVFYSAWDPRFSTLLLFTSVLDFAVGRFIEGAGSPARRRGWLILSIVANLGILGLFKYFNFFRESFEQLLGVLGLQAHWRGWSVVLPVGVSFYTFQSMSYVIDVYRREMPASRNLIQFLAYVSFFPQLVAGPIERGKNLLPQFTRSLRITLEDVELGLWLILWGMFKKVVLADNLASLTELVYDHTVISGPLVALGTIAFGLQIYCDFSGYTDIARGVAKVLGFNLMLNFNLPYFARSLGEFWRRWHISLSTWLRDYLYFPLGGNRQGQARTYRNLGITFLIAGLWHGAAATFVLWGAWHGLGLIANRFWECHRPWGRPLPGWLAWGATGLFVLYGWMIFRAHSLAQVAQFTGSLTHSSLPLWWRPYAANLLVLAVPLAAMEIWQWRSGTTDNALQLPRWGRAALQAVMALAILVFWQSEARPFIYFQF
jgi:D-alanyl-lipoteichoic acid acyltransferase DltB (MBOAT superfamily)